jgi:hypothetical protein
MVQVAGDAPGFARPRICFLKVTNCRTFLSQANVDRAAILQLSHIFRSTSSVTVSATHRRALLSPSRLVRCRSTVALVLTNRGGHSTTADQTRPIERDEADADRRVSPTITWIGCCRSRMERMGVTRPGRPVFCFASQNKTGFGDAIASGPPFAVCSMEQMRNPILLVRPRRFCRTSRPASPGIRLPPRNRHTAHRTLQPSDGWSCALPRSELRDPPAATPYPGGSHFRPHCDHSRSSVLGWHARRGY